MSAKRAAKRPMAKPAKKAATKPTKKGAKKAIFVKPKVKVKPKRAVRAVIAPPNGENGDHKQELEDKINQALLDLKLMDGILVDDPQGASALKGSKALAASGKDRINSYVARNLRDNLDDDTRGPRAGKLNNLGCALAWLFKLGDAKAALEEAASTAKGTKSASIRETAQHNLTVLGAAWTDWEAWAQLKGK